MGLKIEDFINYKAYKQKKERGFIIKIEKDEDGDNMYVVQNVTSDLNIVTISEYDDYSKEASLTGSKLFESTYDIFVDLALSTKDNVWLKELSDSSKVRRKIIE